MPASMNIYICLFIYRCICLSPMHLSCCFCFSGETDGFSDLLSCPCLDFQNRRLETQRLSRLQHRNPGRPVWTAFCLLYPTSPPALIPALCHIQPPGLLAGSSLGPLRELKSSPPLLSGVTEFHAHDQTFSPFRNPCHLQESLPPPSNNSDFFQVIRPRSLPSSFHWVSAGIPHR